VVTTKLEGPLAALRESEIRLMNDIIETLADIGDLTADDRSRLQEVIRDLRDLFFLVVVIGEFNSGKSSFINSLLGESILPTGITPTTEAIELIRYGDKATYKPKLREDGIREWQHPNTGGAGVAIVDTPGTGSVFQKHEKTAKAFLHRSDLVIFVISAKHAFAETERLYLELAKQYGKKVIIVVNQTDLLQPREQEEVRRFIERQVKDKLDIEPLLFMVSAKTALESSNDDGGIDAVKAHLRGVFAEAPPAKQKLLAQLDLADRIVRQYLDDVKKKAALVSSDTMKVHEVEQELEQQAAGLEVQLAEAKAEIDLIFDGIRKRGLNFITTNLSVRKVGRVPSREALQAEFQDVVIGRALRDVNEVTGDYVNAVIDNSRLYWRSVIERLNQLRDLLEQDLADTGMDAGVYAEQRESLQGAIRIAEAELKSYSTGQVAAEIQRDFAANMGGFTRSAATGIVGLVVAVAAVAAPGPLAGTGAALLALPAFVVGAPAALAGGILALRYYRRITAKTRRDFNQRLDDLQKSYHDALDELTHKERNRLAQYGKQVLTPIFSRLEVLAERYAQQEKALLELQERSTTLRAGITGSQ